jgi:ABC-2 type transport system permease protein
MISRVQQTWAFFYRDWQLTRRYWSWVVVFTFYATVTSATVALIGVAANDPRLTLTLTIGALLWTFLSVLFNEIAMSIAFERWEGTLEYTFMAPVSRLIHLMGVSLYALTYSLVRVICVLGALWLMIDLPFDWSQLPGVAVVLAVSSVAFVGLGLIAAILPVMSPERGAEATNILQGVLLLISGVYYPVSVLPSWIQPLAWFSPATYALSASRRLLGLEGGAPATFNSIVPDLLRLLLLGVVLVPFGLWVFGKAENWAKRNGKLKRTG